MMSPFRFVPLVAVAVLLAAPARAQAPTVEQVLKASLDQSLAAFNTGDFEGYLHDFAPQLDYNGLRVDRARLVDINKELRDSFKNLSMKYERIRVNTISPDEAAATTVTEFSGSTTNYDNSGLAATYRETGQVTALYKRAGERWTTGLLDVAWNDSYIDIGQNFGAIGFSTLPTLGGTKQPYRFRLFVGEDERPGFGVAYAYTTAPLKNVIEKAGAEEVFKQLQFKPVPTEGVEAEFHGPDTPGTYAHVLVINKYWKAGNNESIVGQKIYTRLMRVE
ncbi:MAG: hypothetical protein JWM80_3212 [Cyanobacteria bacterium RYN_339]|nr:hypothetical protein [Cyanobacteria bacterium RYN_339]